MCGLIIKVKHVYANRLAVYTQATVNYTMYEPMQSVFLEPLRPLVVPSLHSRHLSILVNVRM